jgi:hypothetical protein
MSAESFFLVIIAPEILNELICLRERVVSILCTLEDISPIHRFYRILGYLEDTEVYYNKVTE